MQHVFPLTIQDAITIAAIVRAAQHGDKVAWLPDEGSGEIHFGTMRSIGDPLGNFLTRNVDVRDGFVRITSDRGFDYFMPMRDAMRMHESGELVINPLFPNVYREMDKM